MKKGYDGSFLRDSMSTTKSSHSSTKRLIGLTNVLRVSSHHSLLRDTLKKCFIFFNACR